MRSLFTFTSGPRPCSYLPGESATLVYDLVGELTKREYLQFMLDGRRRFGRAMFRPECAACDACRALRVDAARFRPDRSQRRAMKANADVRLEIGSPSVSDEKLALSERYHEFQSDNKGWPFHGTQAEEYAESFVNQPFAVEEWRYYLGEELIGVGYVDVCDEPAAGGARGAEGLSAIYFYYEPALRDRGLGTFNVVTMLDVARRRGLPWVYLGYYVEGCGSLAYKARFMPNEVGEGGTWRAFRVM